MIGSLHGIEYPKPTILALRYKSDTPIFCTTATVSTTPLSEEQTYHLGVKGALLLELLDSACAKEASNISYLS